MKALVKYAAGAGNMELREVAEPCAGPGEVKIRVMAASICGSDLHILQGDIGIPMRLPVIPGHEFAGVIEQIGEGVDGIAVGDRVTGENTRYACGSCRQCASGSYNLCAQRMATGYAFDGAFARYVVVPGPRVHRLPAGVDFRCGALTDPSACAYHAVHEMSGIRAEDVVLITGPGAMGLLCLQYAKAKGATVILAGLPEDAARLELGRGLGADHAFAGADLKRSVLKVTGADGPDVVLECAGSEAASESALDLVRREGRYTQVGIFGRPVAVDLDKILYKEVILTGSFSQKYSGWEEALKLCAAGKIKVAPLITHVFPLSAWREAFEVFAKREAIKVIFDLKEGSENE